MKKFLSGEVGLATAYWLITLPCYVILAGLAAAIHLKPKEPSTIAWVAGLMLVMVITSIGLWKSASNYAGLALWKYLVKLGCVLSIGVVGTVAFLAVTDGVKALKGSTVAAESFQYDVYNLDDSCKQTSTKPDAHVEFLPNDERREVFRRVSTFARKSMDLVWALQALDSAKAAGETEDVKQLIALIAELRRQDAARVASAKETTQPGSTAVSTGNTDKKFLEQLKNCTYMDTKNWSCGSETGSKIRYSMIAGEFSFEHPGQSQCLFIYKRVQ